MQAMSMVICQLTDLHVRVGGSVGGGLPDTSMFTEQACRAAAKLEPRPDVVIITGDLTDSGSDAEYANLLDILNRSLPVPTFVIPGNHDQRQMLRAKLGHLIGATTDPGLVQYVVEDYPVRLVMLDTLVPGANHGILSDSQLSWLDTVLGLQPSKPTMVVMHHPPFVTGLPHMDQIALSNADAFRSVIERHQHVGRIICGHHHRPVIGQCAHAIVTVSPSVAHQIALTFDANDTGAFNFEPPAILLHRWTPDTGFVTHTVYTASYPGPFPFVMNPT